jgi:CTP synthase
MSANVPADHVVGCHNVNSIYKLPEFMNDLKVDDMIVEVLNLKKKFHKNEASVKKWTEAMAVHNPKKHITIAIAGKYTGASDTYISILKALEHCEAKTQSKVNVKWIETTNIENGKSSIEVEMHGVDGLIVPGGFGSRGVEGKITCVKYAREHRVPYLGLCYGFQIAVIEFARNVLGLKDANSTECDTKTPYPVICILPEKEEIEELGGTLRLGGYDVVIDRGTMAYALYGRKEKIRERFRHRFNVNTKYIDRIIEGGMVFSGRAPKKRIMQIMELPKETHPFFMGTQFHPEFTSKPTKPNPLYLGLVNACIERKK